MSKYKYYFTKPKSEIAVDILQILLVSGLLIVAAGSPYFVSNLMKSYKRFKRYKNNKISDTFYRLRKSGCIDFQNKNGQVYISLTKKGKMKAGWMQIDNLKIKKSKKWDGKWRIVMFDIAHLKRLYRDILRGKLKELGFLIFQKSVWIIPYKCEDEINLIKDFLGLTDKEVRLVVSENIGDDNELKKKFKLS